MKQLSMALSLDELKKLTNKLRIRVMQMSYNAKAPHLGSSLSCIDILAVIYWNFLKLDIQNQKSEERDRFVLSKGHAAAALYATLAFKGIISLNALNDYVKDGMPYAEHPSPHNIPGVEAATGSLGHGLSIACGIALAAKTKDQDYTTIVVISDGECNEGSTWEAALFATANKLDNLITFIDYNKWQATGRSNDILALAPLKQKWEAFGWETYEIDGHNHHEIITVMENLQEDNEKPKMIIANTIKGKGISFMEDNNNWHYRIPTEEEIILAKKELQIE